MRIPYNVLWTYSLPFSNSIHIHSYLYPFLLTQHWVLFFCFPLVNSRLFCLSSLGNSRPTTEYIIKDNWLSHTLNTCQISTALHLMVRFYTHLSYFKLGFLFYLSVYVSFYAKTIILGLYVQLPCCAWKTLFSWYYFRHMILQSCHSFFHKDPWTWMNRESSCICPFRVKNFRVSYFLDGHQLRVPVLSAIYCK